jgi:hypothetical protein
MTTSSNTTGFGSLDWLMSAINKNPEGLLLLAAGCALLLRTGSWGGRHPPQQYQSEHGEQSPQIQHVGSRGKDWELSEGISQAAENARDYASNVSKAVGEKTRSFAAAAGEYVEGARDTVKGHSGRIAEQTQSTIERIVREQPLAVAVAGLAVGAAVAAAFRATQVERETLGEAARRLSEVASSAGERLSEAASAAGERLRSVAEEKGLEAEGLKDVAGDVAGAFGKSFSGKQDDSGAAKQATSGIEPTQSKARSKNPAIGQTEPSGSTTAEPRSSNLNGNPKSSNA